MKIVGEFVKSSLILGGQLLFLFVGLLLNGHDHFVEGCNWMFLGADRSYGGAGSPFETKIANTSGMTLLPAANSVGSLTAAALEGTDVFFENMANNDPPLTDTERQDLVTWLASGSKTMIVTGISTQATQFQFFGQLGGSNVTCEVAEYLSADGTYDYGSIYDILEASGAEDEPLIQGVAPTSSEGKVTVCGIVTTSSPNVKPLLVGNVRGVEKTIVAMEDSSTGSSFGGRIIYIADYFLWYDATRYAAFTDNLINVACNHDPPTSNNTTDLTIPWQIVNIDNDEESGEPSVEAGLSTDESNNALINITQIVRTTGQPNVRYQLFEPDCVTPLASGAIASTPSLSQESIASSEEALVTSNFLLNVNGLQNLTDVWTDAADAASGGTASICTVVELMSDDTANAESLYMLETIVTATIDLVANIVMATAANVDAIGQADQANSNASIEGNVVACHCNDETAACYPSDSAPALSQGKFLNICLKFPDGFDSGTIRSMAISQGGDSDGVGARASSDVIIEEVARASYTTIGESPVGSPTDLIVTTMAGVDFFRFRPDETDRSSGLPPLSVTGSVVLGGNSLLQSSSNRDLRRLKERPHAGVPFAVEVNVVPSEDSSFPIMTTTNDGKDATASTSGAYISESSSFMKMIVGASAVLAHRFML